MELTTTVLSAICVLLQIILSLFLGNLLSRVGDLERKQSDLMRDSGGTSEFKRNNERALERLATEVARLRDELSDIRTHMVMREDIDVGRKP